MREVYPNRRFQLWDYNVSHRQLLLRSPGDDDGSNLDVIFTDVRYIQLPTELHGLVLRSPSSGELRSLRNRFREGVSHDDVYILDSQDEKSLGMIVAGTQTVQSNDLDLFESSLARFGEPILRAIAYEQSVLLALAKAFPSGTVEPFRPGAPDVGVDAILRSGDSVVEVEAKYLRGQQSTRAVRRTVMELVDRINSKAFASTKMLLIIGADHDDVVDELRAYMTTAAPHVRVEVAGWLPGDPTDALSSAAERLLESAP